MKKKEIASWAEITYTIVVSELEKQTRDSRSGFMDILALESQKKTWQ